MKLTQEQVEIRQIFRETVINLFSDVHHCKMFGIVNNIALYLGCDYESAHRKLSEIPSIGDVYGKQPIAAWLAHNYREVSDSIFDGKTKQQSLSICAKAKKNPLRSKKRTQVEDELSASTSKDCRKLKAIAELKNNMPDRWQKTSWSVVK